MKSKLSIEDQLTIIKKCYGKENYNNCEILTADNGEQFIGWYIPGGDIETVEDLERNFSDEEILSIYNEDDIIEIDPLEEGYDEFY